MAGALEHTQESAPRTYVLPVLVGHHPRNLVQMSQVVSGPSSQQLRQSNHAEGRMPSQPPEVFWL